MCALFGIHDYSECLNKRQKELLLKVLSAECEVRGTHATGISYIRNGQLEVYKRPIPAHKMQYNLPPEVKVIMGHTRFTTQGSERNNYNNHPFFGRVKQNTFTLAHNGILRNDKELRQSMKLPKTNIETDSYIAAQLIEREGCISFGSLRKVAETVTGSFVFTVLDNRDNLYFVRGDNPLCIYHFDKGFYLYASTEDILMKTVVRLGIEKYAHEEIPVEMGDILMIGSSGKVEKEQFEVAYNYAPPYSYQQYPVYLYERNSQAYKTTDADDDYLKILKQISGLYGYTPQDVEELLAEGWTLSDIEQILYDDSFYSDMASGS